MCVSQSASSSRQRRLQKRSLQNALPALLHNLGSCHLLEGNIALALQMFHREMDLVSQRDGIESLDAAFCNLNLGAAHLNDPNGLRMAKIHAYHGAMIFCRVFGRTDEHIVRLNEFLTVVSRK